MKAIAPSLSARFWGRFFQFSAGACERLAGVESRLVADQLARMKVRQPVFVAGVARSGSTVLLEALASCPEFASMRYCDFPPIWFPYWWTQLRKSLPIPPARPEQRAHGDRIEVTPESPEAFDEPFWMHFFPDRHDPRVDQRLSADIRHPRFEAFYDLHIRKLLVARERQRYLCKGNYNLARLPYLQKLFPDARFVVPLRSPLAHVASLLKQHRLFTRLSSQSPSVAAHLARSGHFEFGPGRKAECVGDPSEAVRIDADFAAGDAVSGYARQWAVSYKALAEQLEQDPGLASATLLVRYEDLCAEPVESLRALADHCALSAQSAGALIESWASRLQAPDYYQPDFTDDQRAGIARQCSATVERLNVLHRCQSNKAQDGSDKASQTNQACARAAG